LNIGTALPESRPRDGRLFPAAALHAAPSGFVAHQTPILLRPYDQSDPVPPTTVRVAPGFAVIDGYFVIEVLGGDDQGAP
jgi:hypothetical protein